MPPEQSLLAIVRNANPAVSERDARALLGSFGFSGDAVNKQSGVLSGGEKIRLAFARIFINPPNVLLLDEPTTNLDIHGREALEKAIRDYQGTVCFVSHDVAFVRGAADHIFAVSNGSVTSFPGGYDYYLEKLDAGGLDSGKGAPPPIESSTAPVSALNPQAARKARAREREAQKALKKMEADMEKLSERQRALCARLSGGDPELDYTALNIELAEVSKKLNALEAEWLEEADRLG
jgi:ATP-binding cassette subfamily F protein 3